MLINTEDDNPSTHTRCRDCGITYFQLYDNPCIACDCDFFREYERHTFGDRDEDEDEFEQPDNTDRIF